MNEERAKFLIKRSAQLRRKRWEGTITMEEDTELHNVQMEILNRKMYPGNNKLRTL